ncbi:hypothetical protein [Pelagicoccus sp. SDUM812003]|uniref:hypothetical protein n=1 Tax=Pelagicoccus sp. SDUM812003 TaxID=3041267 RepID=UPI00280F6A42|nr:hypothetical protein [Pelagicoccus sp. SDUM812003]MDQ8203475.1 hypothetical protein [Pelagicoccus sp. SDUM812003]
MNPLLPTLLIFVLSLSFMEFLHGEIVFRNQTPFEADIIVQISSSTVTQKRKAMDISEGPSGEIERSYRDLPPQEVIRIAYTLSLSHNRGESEIVAEWDFYNNPGLARNSILFQAFDTAYDGENLYVAAVKGTEIFVETFERIEESQGTRWDSRKKVDLGTTLDLPKTFQFAKLPNGQTDTSRIQLGSSTITWSELSEDEAKNVALTALSGESSMEQETPTSTPPPPDDQPAEHSQPLRTDTPEASPQSEPQPAGSNKGAGYWSIAAFVIIAAAILLFAIRKFAQR